MTVTFLFFARAREIVGAQQLTLDLPDRATLFDAKQMVLTQYPGLAELFTYCTFSVDREYSQDETKLTEGSEIGCIPPVSGG